MAKYIVIANFHIFVHAEKQPPRKVSFTKGMVIGPADVPVDQSAEAWEAAGLVKKADPLDHDGDGRKGGAAARTATA